MAYSKRGIEGTEKRKPLRIKTGDDVIVIQGKSRDPKTARKVLATLPKEGKIIVEGVNIMRERNKNKGGARPSGINQQESVEKPFPIDVSNVMLADPKTGKATRVKMSRAGEKPSRVAVKSGETF